MTNKKLHIVYLGFSGFPLGLAENQKIILISRGLIHAGCSVTVINRKGTHPKNVQELPAMGEFKNIKYVYTSGSSIKPQKFVKRNFLKVVGSYNEFKLLMSLKKKGKLQAGIISSESFPLVLYYKLISLILGFKIILNLVEYDAEGKEKKAHWGYRINSRLFKKFALAMVDGILPISEFLVEVVKQKYPLKPFLKVPTLCDYELFKKPEEAYQNEEYFLFCGSVAYMEVLEFILDAFQYLPNHRKTFLYLVVNGNKAKIKKLKKRIDGMEKVDLVKTFSKLPYEDLVQLYLGAKALLIPMRPVLKDIARFPHKIGEYTASGNPIITTNVGEIPHYFTHNENALIATAYDPLSFSKEMTFVLDNPEKARMIGVNGKELGLENFDYQTYGIKIRSFIERIID